MKIIKKKKEQPLILYEKYKFDHHLYQNRNVSAESHKSMAKMICNVLVTSILMVMVFLSAIGVITLIDPQMRLLLENIVRV